LPSGQWGPQRGAFEHRIDYRSIVSKIKIKTVPSSALQLPHIHAKNDYEPLVLAAIVAPIHYEATTHAGSKFLTPTLLALVNLFD